MEQELRRLPDGTYAGAMTDEHICGIFGCCGDWNRREVRIGALTVYVYAIDGITSGGDASEYVVKPLMQDAFGGTMDELYDRALHRTVYNSVAVPCEDLQSAAEKLVNGFTVVLFGQRAIAFETKTGEKRSPSAPEVENTVKGPKDAFTETVRTNTSLLRRHLRTPALRLYETVVGQRSLTNVTLAWIDGLTDPALVQRPAQEEQLRYEELQTLSRIGMQVLHEDAVAPVQRAQIPLRICNTHDPENPGTLVRPQMEPGEGQICFAGRRQLAMLRLTCPQEPDAEAKLAAILTQAQLSPFSMQSVCGELTVLLPMKSGSERLHRLQEQAAQALLPQSCTLRENLSILAALCRSTATVPKLLRAVEKSGAPVHLLQKCGACALMLVNDSQYEQSLRAAYSASRDLHD